MKCKRCQQHWDITDMYDGSSWCRRCVEIELLEQKLEDSTRVKPEVFHT